MTTGRPRNFELVRIIGEQHGLEGLVGHLVFKADDLDVGAKLGSDLLDQLDVEGLVDSNEDATHEEGRDQILSPNFKFLG